MGEEEPPEIEPGFFLVGRVVGDLISNWPSGNGASLSEVRGRYQRKYFALLKEYDANIKVDSDHPFMYDPGNPNGYKFGNKAVALRRQYIEEINQLRQSQ
jgi:hypothetical protein